MTPEELITFHLAEHARTVTANRTVRALQRLDPGLAVEDSVLKNLWEEICVQVQDQESLAWPLYTEIISDTIAACMDALSSTAKQALWLQTEAGMAWSVAVGDDATSVPTSSGDLVQAVEGAVLATAAVWSNPRIRLQLGRSRPD